MRNAAVAIAAARIESSSLRPTPRRRWFGKTNKSLICQKWPSRSDAGTAIVMAKPTTRSFSSATKAFDAAAADVPFKRYLWSVSGLAIVSARQVEDLCELSISVRVGAVSLRTSTPPPDAGGWLVSSVTLFPERGPTRGRLTRRSRRSGFIPQHSRTAVFLGPTKTGLSWPRSRGAGPRSAAPSRHGYCVVVPDAVAGAFACSTAQSRA
jgi:hypothetical protein